jgi:RNA polymerase sigma-70 factor (ECF subfamily)
MMKYAISKFRSFGESDANHYAEDAVQNTFMKIVKHIDNINFSRGERDIKNYCLSILHNEICNLLSDKTKFYELDEELYQEDKYTLIEEIEIREKYQEVVEAIKKMDEKYSITLYLIMCEEKTVNEIADMMGIPPKTVYTRLARGKKLLLESLKEKINE